MAFLKRNTLKKVNPPVIEHIADENRDPKVYCHEKSKAYYMVLFLEGNQFGMDNTCELKYTPEDFRATQIQLLGAGGISYAAEVNDNEIQFDAETGILTINGEQAFMGRNVHEMSILIDAEICEVTTENGLYYGIFELKPSCNIQEWRICSKEMLSIKVMEIS